MNRYKWLSVLLIGVLFLGFVPQEVTEAQGLDLNRHCRQHGRERAVNIDGTAYGWRCEDSSGNLHPISIQDACNEQYGAGYTAQFRSMSDPNSWYCAAPSQPPAPPPPAAQADPQQSQPAQAQSQSSAAPAQQSWPVTDGCTDHPEQIYAGESSPPGGDYLRVNVANLRVRMGPGTNYCMNGYAVQGRYYPVHNVKGSWALITGTYGAGWLHLDYVTLYGNYAPAPAPDPDPASQFDLESPYDQWDFSTQVQMLQAMLDIDWQSAMEMLNDMWDCGVTASGLSAALAQAANLAASAPDFYTRMLFATAGFSAGVIEYVEPDTAGQCALAVWERFVQ